MCENANEIYRNYLQSLNRADEIDHISSEALFLMRTIFKIRD